jgi:hypothetical protein
MQRLYSLILIVFGVPLFTRDTSVREIFALDVELP